MGTRQRNVADVLVACLQANGVQTVFGVPGEETTDLVAAIKASGLEFVLCRHEQSAAFMASVHGRLTRRPAVCLATLGPGAANLVTGVADATLDFAPVIALTGQGARARLGRESHQVVDLEALFAPITKQSRRLAVADEVPQAVAEAVRLARAEKPGAVHLTLPEDLAAQPSDLEPIVAPEPPKVIAADTDLARAADAIEAAGRPLIVAGNGVVRSDAAAELRALAEKLGAPVLTTFMAKGVLPPDHPLNLHSVGQPHADHADDALARADLLIAVGYDPVEYPPEELIVDGTATVVHIAETAPQMEPDWPARSVVAGDLGGNLERLASRLPRRARPDWFDGIRTAFRDELARRVTADGADALAPQDICRMVTRVLRPDDTLLSGVGLHKLWVARHVIPSRPGQVIIPNGLAGMGLALPGAIEAARLNREGRVIAICGDGDFMMNVQEMETAARRTLPITVMIWEDCGFGLIDEKQEEDTPGDGGEAASFGFGNPDWSDLSRAFGWIHADVDRLETLEATLQHAADAAMPTLLRVRVDYAAAGGMPRATSKKS